MPSKNHHKKHHKKNYEQAQDPWLAFEEKDLNVDPRYTPQQPAPEIAPKSRIRGCHRNACRTKVHLLLDKREGKLAAPKPKKRKSLFLMSEDYRRKMSEGFDIPEQEYQAKRKISWSEESEFIAFNNKKSCQAVKQAQRHKFSIDQ